MPFRQDLRAPARPDADVRATLPARLCAGRLLAVAEAYPDLKANQNFLDLQAQLEGTENRINVSRQRFNEAVNDYNTSRRSFPFVLLSGMFGFGEKGYFKAEAGAEKAPEVKF